MDPELDWPDFVWPDFVWHWLDSDRSAFDWSELHSRYPGLTFGCESSLLPSTFYNNHHLLTRHEIHRSLLRQKGRHVPVEIFSEIFLYTIQAYPRSRRELMLVCRHWYDIMLSTPGIHSQLRIYRGTERRDVERFGKRWLLDVTVDPEHDDRPWLKRIIDPVEFHACFMAAAKAASTWRSLALLSLPPPGEYEDLQIVHPLQHLESFKLAANCKLGNSLEPLLKALATTVTPRCTVIEVLHPDSALYLLQLAHFQNFSSLTTLRLICRKMQNPVDVLPSLHKLEIFEAHHLFLPIYPPGVDLPLTQTLRVLHLKSVSIQWMAGQIFPALDECSIIFPPHSDALHSVDMPSCLNLKYHSNNLSALEHFHISTLDKLEIHCGQWKTWSGNLQLIRLHPIFAAQSLTCLHMEIKCSEWLLTYMLRLAPTLEELWMRLSSPHALSSAFFLALAGGGRKANAGPSIQAITPLARKLRKLGLHYKRWLRGPERHALIPAFGAVVASHLLEDQIFSFRLSIGEGSELQEWDILEPVERFDFGSTEPRTHIGVSSAYGIAPLSRTLVDDNHGDDDDDDSRFDPLTESKCLLLPNEPEYITSRVRLWLPLENFLSFHCLKEVRMPRLSLKMKQDAQLSSNAPLFHTLKVLQVSSISSSFFAGQTFHNLERFEERRIRDESIPGQGQLTEMPVCTILVVPHFRLATLKLPQIRELGVHTFEEGDHSWKKDIAVNANLSGLKLLHLQSAYSTWQAHAVIKILGLSPALETLIIGHGFLIDPIVDFFKAFVPMNVPGPSALNQSGWKGQISGVLCPKLESLQIEGISPTERAELMHVLKGVVTVRGIIGSPLKSFTFYCYHYQVGSQKWQLIGKDENFMMVEVVPAEPFVLDI